jgi:preprotein translocase subunit SecD
MKKLYKILFFMLLCYSFILSNAYPEEAVLAFRLVHPDHDKLVNISPSNASVDKKQYELFSKGNENYWVDRKVELGTKAFIGADVQYMTMDTSNTIKWRTIEPGSDFPPEAACSVVLHFSKDSQNKIETLTKTNLKRRLAIIYNDQLLMAPIIQEEMSGETMTLCCFPCKEAMNLKSAMKR